MKTRVRENTIEQSLAGDHAPIQVVFDATAFPILVVQKACHSLSRLASFDISQIDEKSRISVNVHPKIKDVGLLLQSLREEVLDQRVREVVRAETEGVRNLILAHAFSRTGLISDDSTEVEAE
jgi:His-Xaa-Ser system protein HxsD